MTTSLLTSSAPQTTVAGDHSDSPADGDDLRTLLRSALEEPARHDGTNPVAAFIAIHPALTAFLQERAPGITSVVHLSQELRMRGAGPLRLTPTPSIRCRLVEVRPDARGSRVTVASELLGADGVVVASGLSTVLLGGIDPASVAVDAPGSGDTDAPVVARALAGVEPFVRSARISSTFSSLYALVSHDDNPIHVDADAARAAGFDGAIAHGMSVVALALEVVADGFAEGDVSRIKGFGVRFSAPVACDSVVDIEVAQTEHPSLVALRAGSPAGLSLKAAWVELSSVEPSSVEEAGA